MAITVDSIFAFQLSMSSTQQSRTAILSSTPTQIALELIQQAQLAWDGRSRLISNMRELLASTQSHASQTAVLQQKCENAKRDTSRQKLLLQRSLVKQAADLSRLHEQLECLHLEIESCTGKLAQLTKSKALVLSAKERPNAELLKRAGDEAIRLLEEVEKTFRVAERKEVQVSAPSNKKVFFETGHFTEC
jgi:hypothetical protein